jgi:serine/threonine protein kinase
MIAKQCLECLSKLKDLDVIHGDIKKSNLIWEPIYNYLTLIDFGFAERCKKSTRVIQSNFYRAPEIFLGKEHDESADMWSVGCLFFSLFTNEEIFSYPIFLNEKGNEIKKKLYIFLLNKIQAHVGPIPQKWLEETLHKDILLQKDENDKYQLKPSKYIVFIPGLDLSWQERMRKQGVNRNLNENQKRELEALIDLTSRMLTYDRITPKEALSHSFFQGFDIPFYIRLKDREESVSMDVYLISSEEKEVEEDFQENEVEFFCRLPSHRFENTCLHLPANKGECYLRIYHHDEGYEIIDDIPVKITPHSTLVIDSQQRQIKLIKA